jgi:hypothetical protein
MAKIPTKKKSSTRNSSKQIGAPLGFGGAINKYLNQYIAISDSKAGAIIAANVVIITILASLDIPNEIFGTAIYIAVILFSVSTISSTMAIYPRVIKNDPPSVIFWEDIRGYKNFDEY